MNTTYLISLAILLSLASCEYPYIFGNSLNTRGIANGLGENGIASSQTTNWALDDVSQSVSYANGTGESNARSGGESIWSPSLTGANTTASAANSKDGNALTDSVSKSFNPSQQYYNENYKQYINYLNSLFQKYPEKKDQILKIVLKYAADLDNIDQFNKLNVNVDVKKNQQQNSANNDNKNFTTIANLNNNDNSGKYNVQVDVKKRDAQFDVVARANDNSRSLINGYPATIANFNNPDFQSIGQTTFDFQRARGSGLKPSASSNSGSFRWNNATVHQGDAIGSAANGWATSSANNYGYGRVNYINSEQNSGAYGKNAQTNSTSNYYLNKDAIWNNGQATGRSEGKDSLAFSNLNGNSYGYGALNGNTNSYTNGDVSVSTSEVKGAPVLPPFNNN